MISQHLTWRCGVHGSSSSEDIMLLIYHVTSSDHIEGSCELVGVSSLRHVSTLTILVTISIMISINDSAGIMFLICYVTSRDRICKKLSVNI